MRLPGICLAACLASASPAAAQFSLEPDWARRPQEDQLSDRYPKLPLLLSIEGRVLLACDVTATGALTSCVPQDEGPKGFGFGEAAKRMAATFEMRPGIAVSRATPHGTVRIPINFALPPLPPAPPAPRLSPQGKALAARLAAAVDPMRGMLEHAETTTKRLETQYAPGATAAMRAEAATALRAATAARTAQGRQAMSEAVAGRLSEADLAALVAFAESPRGRRWFGQEPVLQDRLKDAWAERGRRYRADARAAFCEDRNCGSPENLSTFLSVDVESAGPPSTDADAPLLFPPWSKQPGIVETIRAWPLSYLFGINAYARAICVIGPLGRPEECAMATEQPAGLGIGAALLRLTDSYRVAPDFLAAGVGRKVVVQAIFPADFQKPSPPGPSTTASAARLALAHRLVAIQDADATLIDEEPQLVKAMKPLEVLEPDLRAAAEAALRAAAQDGREDWSRTRAGILAEALSEDELRETIRFEETTGRALRKALAAARSDLQALGQRWSNDVADDARASFCKSRDCATPPPFALSPAAQPGAASPTP